MEISVERTIHREVDGEMDLGMDIEASGDDRLSDKGNLKGL